MDNDQLKLTDFDCLTCGSYFQMIKAYIPYVPADKQSSIAIFIRVVELLWTIDFYKKGPPLTFQRTSMDIKDILKEIRPFCMSKDLELLETFSNLGNINEMMNLVNSPTESLAASMLSDEQKKLYEQFKKNLNI